MVTKQLFKQDNNRAIYTRKNKPRLILDEMCRLYGKFASYLRRVLCKTRLIFPRINGPIKAQMEKTIILIDRCFI